MQTKNRKQRKIPLAEPGTGRAFTTWLPASVLFELDAQAERLNLSRSAAIKEIVLGFFNTQKTETPKA